jgi:hypothetical protein
MRAAFQKIIQDCRALLADAAFRKKATAEQVRELGQAILTADLALARLAAREADEHYMRTLDAARTSGSAPVAMTTTGNPLAVVAALAALTIGAGMVINNPARHDAERAVEEAHRRLRAASSRVVAFAAASDTLIAASADAFMESVLAQAALVEELIEANGGPNGPCQDAIAKFRAAWDALLNLKNLTPDDISLARIKQAVKALEDAIEAYLRCLGA